MVHEGFTVLDGRTVLVRTDDLELQERKDVSAFFDTVRRLAANDGSAQVAGAFAAFVTAVIVLIVSGIIVGGDAPFAWSTLGGILLAVAFFGGVAYFAVREARFNVEYKRREKILGKLVLLCTRSERCRIATFQLQEMHKFYARILVEVKTTAS